MPSPTQSLHRLRDGNRRFVSGLRAADSVAGAKRPAGLPAVQEPFAVVLGCSDSRVPPEMVFDQGLGDLFVIRVAGNVAGPSQIGSVELAVTRLGSPLVVVLGHSRCRAILATLEALQDPDAPVTPCLRSIVDRVRPSVEGLLETELRTDTDALVRHAVRANVTVSVEGLLAGSDVLRRRVEAGALEVVGAEYSLETGVVAFLEGTGAD